MRLVNSIIISPSDLQTTANDEWVDLNEDGSIQSGEWLSYDNIKILIGGCASTGTDSYYFDEDQDGWGAGIEYEFCPGLEPDRYVKNNQDFNDTINCLSNIFDDCGVCDGQNLNIDCNGVCFGNAELDDCGVCENNNQSCLDLIFEYSPYNLHALIEGESIIISWEFDTDLQNTFIEGFKIYYDESNPINIGTTQSLNFETTEFDSGYFCVSAFDRFDNESQLICTQASEYNFLSYNLHEGANLLSFPYIPQNNSLDSIFYSIRNEIEGIIGEGIAASYEESIDSFIGSMDAIYHEKGYWVKIRPGSSNNINLNLSGFPYEGDITYELHEGYNLISYLGQNNLSIEDAIPHEISNSIVSIIGEGTASVRIQNQWVGNLDYLEFGAGYWVKSTNSNNLFYWNSP